MLGPTSFDYATIRVVPYVERQEFINVGIILFCKALDYLDVLIDFELNRLKHFSADSDIDMIRDQLQTIQTICAGGVQAGDFGEWSKSQRFNWLVSPSSTVIQMSPVHCGLSEDPPRELNQLYDLLVA